MSKEGSMLMQIADLFKAERCTFPPREFDDGADARMTVDGHEYWLTLTRYPSDPGPNGAGKAEEPPDALVTIADQAGAAS